MKKLWFRRKSYGWGWTPSTWEGWLTIAIYIGIIIEEAHRIDLKSHSASDTLIGFVPEVLVLTIILIAICYYKGEEPRWQWGRKK